jgi:hypothetical protein
MDSAQYQKIISAIRERVTLRNGHTFRRQAPGPILAFNLQNHLPGLQLEIVYDTSLYILGYIVNNHGYRFRNVQDAFTSESGIAVGQYSQLHVSNDYDADYRGRSHRITVWTLADALAALTHLQPGNNVRFPPNSHQDIFVGFAEAVRFGDVLRDIVQQVTLTNLDTRLDWTVRLGNPADKAVAVL